MPVLSDATLRRLRYLPLAGAAPHGQGLLACWNWALTGLTPANSALLDGMFTFVSYGGHNPGPNPARLAQLRQQWQQHGHAALNGICTELVKLAATAFGLVCSPVPTRYQVVMHYDTMAAGEAAGPNWTHWWLKIDEGGRHDDGIEVFPESPVLTVRRPEYCDDEVCRVYVQELHAIQVTRIDALLRTLVPYNHFLHGDDWVPHGGWIDATTCSICGTWLCPGLSRHHCRCCGRTVCAACSPRTRLALLHGRVAVARAGVAQQPPYRVCLFC